jgi:hypothetical protein
LRSHKAYRWCGIAAGRAAARQLIGRGSRSFAPVWLKPTPSSAQQFSERRPRRRSRRILRSCCPSYAGRTLQPRDLSDHNPPIRSKRAPAGA